MEMMPADATFYGENRAREHKRDCGRFKNGGWFAIRGTTREDLTNFQCFLSKGLVFEAIFSVNASRAVLLLMGARQKIKKSFTKDSIV